MTMFGKRGSSGASSAVLDAPEESYGRELDRSAAEAGIREPAPAGSLQRGRMVDDDGPGGFQRQQEEEVYRARRESASYRLRMGVPKSMAGRLIMGGGLLLVLVAGVVTLALLRSKLMHDERFVVATSSEIQIAGNEHLTRAQILSVFGSDLERNIFKVPLEERRADLERLPWVAHATVMRLLPNHLRIAVTERTPVAFVRQGNQIGLVDASGVLLDMPEDAAGDPHYSFPVLTGLVASDPLSTRAARMEVYRKFMADLDSETGPGATKPTAGLSEVDVSNPEDVKALIANGSSDILVHFGDEDFLRRYKMFEQNLPQWKTQYPKLASVDTRYEHQFVLEMAGAAASESASQLGSKLASQQVSASAGSAAAVKPVSKPAALKAVVAAKPGSKPVAKPVAKLDPQEAAAARLRWLAKVAEAKKLGVPVSALAKQPVIAAGAKPVATKATIPGAAMNAVKQ